MTCFDHTGDEVEQHAVRAVLDPPRGVVLEGDTTLGELDMQLQVRIPIEVREDDALGVDPLAAEQVHDRVSTGADLRVHEDRSPGFSMAHGCRHEPALLQKRDVLVRGPRFDHAGTGRVERLGGQPVVRVHPFREVGEDALRQKLDGGFADPVSRWIVGVAMVARRRHDMNAGRLGHRAHLRRTAPKADGRDLDDRV